MDLADEMFMISKLDIKKVRVGEVEKEEHAKAQTEEQKRWATQKICQALRHMMMQLTKVIYNNGTKEQL